ncbi:asparagine synthase (glutamine-hydrolyzing) [Caminibacter pacificus]|uniref:asparagine synthase (glutamine-hydrolyzing) n=1 Tax=Caminibacter pacificus TaxID=1424653 RepID=A0AAJ4RBG7_9BACT|nr:asparagine synthase (glutamine-hydrolyzing) [Caminibacter pacificus]QCI29021.1 asparagine synthase (glutamine-hydrolyzing) [Caminibacter pacificus]ROR39168.1 asparagine synthase (glutamine-hydrolysing) [Caminibacter pacificus]
MCGIAGFNFEVDKKRVLKTLFHRGPDENSCVRVDNFNFFHTRLAIQDIKNGSQPFFYNDWMIVFNGEIYNHSQLRKNLKEFDFKTNSDTETLLYLFLKYKEKMFDFIDGMFAFAIYDKKNKKLFLARDRAGKKPLYIYKKDKKFAFASEINVFKTLNPTIDEEDIKLFLSTGFCESGYKEIREFPAGHFGYYDGELKLKRYFDIAEYYKAPKIKNPLNELEGLLKISVKNRLFSSDVEVGAFLSGGIDSSLIVAIASEYTDIKTFTVKFEGAYDESYLASLVARKYGLKHEIIDIKMNVKDNIEKILLNYGKPFFDSSAIPSYFVSKAAREHVKVVLNGDGADELFGGYRRYVPFIKGWDKIAKHFTFLLPLLKPKSRGELMFLYRLLRAASKEGIHWYNVLLNDLFEDIYDFHGEKIEKLDKFIKSIDFEGFEKLSYLDFEINLKNLLMKMDIASMSNSLEARSPFLSKYMLEFAPKIDKNDKLLKKILRELAKKYLPLEIVNAPKRGFEIPLVSWVDGELRDVIFDYLNYGFYKNFVDEKLVEKIKNKKLQIPEEKRAKILYLLFALEVWHENSVS